jgi:hypothetical protein
MKFGRRLLSFVNCAKIELETGELCMLEPCLEDFDRACNNDGEGWETLDDRLGAFAHYVFEKTNKRYPYESGTKKEQEGERNNSFDSFIYFCHAIFKETCQK